MFRTTETRNLMTTDPHDLVSTLKVGTGTSTETEFTLTLTEHDYLLIMHALALTGTEVENRRGIEAALQYDELHDRLQNWNRTA